MGVKGAPLGTTGAFGLPTTLSAESHFPRLLVNRESSVDLLRLRADFDGSSSCASSLPDSSFVRTIGFGDGLGFCLLTVSEDEDDEDDKDDGPTQ